MSFFNLFKKKQRKKSSRLKKSTFKDMTYKSYRNDPEFAKPGTKLYDEYREFLRLGGGRSGLYNVSDKKTKEFVRKYSKFINLKEVYKYDKNKNFVPYFKETEIKKVNKKRKRYYKRFMKSYR